MLYTYIDIERFVRICLCMRVYLYIYICIYIYTYMCMYMYICISRDYVSGRWRSQLVPLLGKVLTATKDVAIGCGACQSRKDSPRDQCLIVLSQSEAGAPRSPPMSSRLQAALERYFDELSVPHLAEQALTNKAPSPLADQSCWGGSWPLRA